MTIQRKATEQYFCCRTVYYAVPPEEVKLLTIEMKSLEKHFPLVTFIFQAK